MGFSLKMFFAEMFRILRDSSLTEEEQWNRLVTTLEENYKYAKECGDV